jgi:hypothetical protein
LLCKSNIRTKAEQGYSHKVPAVLPGHVGYAWFHLTNKRFHRGLAESLPLAGESAWYELYLSDADDIDEIWAAATSPAMRDVIAARTARAVLRASSAAHADLWQLVVTEQRVRMLIEAIGGMLNPRPLERLRQAVHK